MDWTLVLRGLEKRGYIRNALLGQGAFSRVYAVEERETGRIRACKISGHVEMAKREADILSSLNHPLFPEIYEYWQERAAAFLMMELIQGDNLEKLIRKGTVFSVCQTAEIGMELAEGLLYLHERRRSVLFRDVKPENIVLRRDGHIKLLDFGCVCVSGENDRSRAGTPGYAAPEQLAGGEQSILCDVYGLGRTLQELLRAGGIQKGQSIGERRDKKKLERILAACAEEKPTARPADMRVVMTALAPFSASSKGNGGYVWGGDFWQEGIVCEKNIWKSMCKTT